MRTLFLSALALALLTPASLRALPGCDPSSSPGCDGCYCEACVCAMDPFCCTASWDPVCATRCVDQCGGCGPAASCGDGVCGPGEACSSCSFDCGDCPAPCGQITVKGCCLDDKLAQCVDGALQVVDCQGSCGWSLDSKSYVCGGAGHDPEGVYPLACPQVPEDPDVVISWPEICQGLTWTGCCKDTTLYWCDGVGLQSLDCGANPAPLNTCGWVGGEDGYYDCGGEGGDPAGTWDLECDEEIGEIEEPPPEDVCTVGETIQVGCGDVSFSGCCGADQDLVFCEGGKLLCALHCGQLPSPLDTCGWKEAGETGFYDCGGDGLDPSGQNPILCPDWTPEEDIVGDGLADSGATWACPDIPVGGCCEGSTLHYCNDGGEASFDCADMSSDPVFGEYVHCGLDEVTGEVSCLKKEDPNPPDCEVPVEPSPEPVGDVVEPEDGVVMDTIGEVMEEVGGGDGTSSDLAGQADLALLDNAWVWPDIPPTGPDTEDEVTGGGGGKGCTAGPRGGPGALLTLLSVLMLTGLVRRMRSA